MPELPEVETVVRELREQVLDRRIIRARLLRPDMLKNPDSGPGQFSRFFRGRSVRTIERYGKFLLFTLDNGHHLLGHLGMTGKFVVVSEDEPQPRWLCSQYLFDDGGRLDHVDVRRLGRLEIYPKSVEIPVLARLGKDPLSPEFGGEEFRLKLKSRTRAIHTLLLDQSLIAGVGNIYAAEALFRAGIRPTRPAGKITKNQLERLTAALQNVLNESLDAGGTTVNNYRRVDDKPGNFRLMLRVYDRLEEACLVCGNGIRRVTLGGRSAYYCPKCQK
jgi:formamidopyrimidine-DNA glycosylase